MSTFNNHSLFLLSLNRFCYDVGKLIGRKYNLTVNERNALIVLSNVQIRSLKIFSELLQISNTHTSKVITSLEKKRLILRLLDNDDKRYIRLLLTEEGKQVAENMIQDISDLFESRINQLPDDLSARAKKFSNDYVQITKNNLSN